MESNKPIKIYYATMTGNAEMLADLLLQAIGSTDSSAELVDLCDVKPDQLAEETYAAFIVSTWGDGDPPDDAEEFWTEFEEAELDLSKLNYGVFGLGDRDYAEFNAFARNMDNRLAALGASQIIDRFEADVDYDDDFEAWKVKFVEAVSKPAPAV